MRLPVLTVDCLTTFIDHRCTRSVLDDRGENLTFTFEFSPGWATSSTGAFVGGHIGRVIPVPIPNTVVKPAKPMILLQRESRSLPAINQRTPARHKRPGFFFAPIGTHRSCCYIEFDISSLRWTNRSSSFADKSTVHRFRMKPGEGPAFSSAGSSRAIC